MQTRHPLRAALVATVAPLIAIVLFGNSWFTEHVRLDGDHGPLALRLYATLAPFTWTVTPRNGPGAGTIWAAQILGIVAVLGGSFLLIWAIARHATGSSLLLGAWAATIPVAMLGAFVTTFVSYGAFYGDGNVDGTGRFWFSVFQSQNVALWGVWVGLFVGVLAAVTAGGVDNRPDYETWAPIPGSVPVRPPQVAAPPAPEPEPAMAAPSVWAQQTYVAVPVYTGALPDAASTTAATYDGAIAAGAAAWRSDGGDGPSRDGRAAVHVAVTAVTAVAVTTDQRLTGRPQMAVDVQHSAATLRRRKVLSRTWGAVVVGWSLIRTLIVWAALGDYGLNPWIYLSIDLTAAVIDAFTTPRMVLAFIDNQYRLAAKWLVISAAAFVVPDLYLFLGTRTLPKRVILMIIAIITFTATVAIVSVVRKILKGRREREQLIDELLDGS